MKQLTESNIARNKRVLKIPKTKGHVTMTEAQTQYDTIKSVSADRNKKARL